MTTSRPRERLMEPGVVAAGAGAVPDARMHATVSATPTVNISGTAMRSARATARGPRHTTIVAIRPSAIAHAVGEAPAGTAHVAAARAHADAAITLFSAIHAKLVTYRTTA